MGTYRYITFKDRKKIEKMMNENIAIRAIASQLDLCLSTVYREIERGKQTNGIYNAVVAQETVENNRRRRGRKKK